MMAAAIVVNKIIILLPILPARKLHGNAEKIEPIMKIMPICISVKPDICKSRGKSGRMKPSAAK